MSESNSLIRSARSVSLATLISRVLGLAREQAQSYFFGASAVTDAFVAAFRIPNLLRDLFAEGALSSAFVPTFTGLREREGSDAAWHLANRVLTALIVILGALAVVIFVAAPGLTHLYAPKFGPEKAALAATMTRILAPFLLCVAAAAVAMGILNVFGRFFVPTLAPAWFNVAAIAGMAVLGPLFARAGLEPALSLAVGAMAGGAIQFLVQLPAMKRDGFRYRWDWAPRDPGLRRVATLMLPAVFGLAATQLSILIDTMLASGFGDGPMTSLQIAFRLMQLPIGLFGVALATANMTRVSRDAARGDLDALRRNLGTSLRTAALLTLPATAGLVALREPIIRLLFEHGRFRAAATADTAAALLCYALGLYAYAVTKIQVPTFYALGTTRVPVQSSAVAISVKIGMNFLLIPLFAAAGWRPFTALATTTSLAAWINFGLLAWGLHTRLGSLRGLGIGSTTAKVAALSAVMGAAVAGLYAALTAAWPAGGHVADAARLFFCIAAGIVIAGGGARLLGVEEARALLARARFFAGGKSAD